MTLNTRRGIRRACLALAAAWVPLVLLYPFYSRRQYHAGVSDKAEAFYEACIAQATRPYDEAVRGLAEARRALDDANSVGARMDRVNKALNLFLEADRTKDEASRAKALAMKRCPEAKERLVAEAYQPELNAYQWFSRPRSGRIWYLSDRRLDRATTLEFLMADTTGWNDLSAPILPASIVFPVAVILPPLILYYVMIGGVGLVGWIARGFTNQPSPNDPG